MATSSQNKEDEGRNAEAQRTPKDRPRRGLYGQRPGKSHDEIVRQEFRRINAMTARDRVTEALRLDGELRAILTRRGQKPEWEPSA